METREQVKVIVYATIIYDEGGREEAFDMLVSTLEEADSIAFDTRDARRVE